MVLRRVKEAMGEVDILGIHTKIRKRFSDDKEKLPEYRERLQELDASLATPDLKPHVSAMMQKARDDLAKDIDDLEHNVSRDFYNSKSNELISSYGKILNTAIKKSFMKKAVVEDGRLEKKREIVREYLELAREYIEIEVPLSSRAPIQRVVCDVCDNKKHFEVIDENVYTCQSCFSQQTVMRNTPSWNDIGRVNPSQKYVYDRRVHFRDCILQYQGKQNSTIPQKVYDDVTHHLEIHGALMGRPGDTRETRFSKLTKKLLRDFLSELGYNKHYENIHLIHATLTGIQPDDISHLEEMLMDEFDQLTAVYDEDFKDLDRKSFVSTQCVLYQLLKKHNHPCEQSDFNIIKTPERKCDHDDILRHLFQHLSWSYAGLF